MLLVRNFIKTNIYAEEGKYVHVICRESYTNKFKVLSREKINKSCVSPKKKHPERGDIDCDKPKCFLCKQPEKISRKGTYGQRGKLIPVRTTEYQDTILNYCAKPGVGDE